MNIHLEKTGSDGNSEKKPAAHNQPEA